MSPSVVLRTVWNVFSYMMWEVAREPLIDELIQLFFVSVRPNSFVRVECLPVKCGSTR